MADAEIKTRLQTMQQTKSATRCKTMANGRASQGYRGRQRRWVCQGVRIFAVWPLMKMANMLVLGGDSGSVRVEGLLLQSVAALFSFQKTAPFSHA